MNLSQKDEYLNAPDDLFVTPHHNLCNFSSLFHVSILILTYKIFYINKHI